MFSDTDKAVIQYRGVDFVLSRNVAIGSGSIKVEVNEERLANYGVNESFSPSGFVTRMNNYLEGQTGKLEQLEEIRKEATEQAEALKSRIDQPFEQAGLLQETRERHADVKRRLLKSTQLESVPKEQIPAFKSLVESRKKALTEQGLGDALNEYEGNADNNRLFSKQGDGAGVTTEQATAELRKDKALAKLLDSGKLNVVQSEDDKAPVANLVGIVHRGVAANADAQEGFDATVGVNAANVKVISKSDIEGMDAAKYSRSTIPDTITVDGKERPTTNSNGQPIADIALVKLTRLD